MSGLAGALQAAIYTALAAAHAPVKVYDAVPQGAAYPYNTIGEDFAREFDTKTGAGEDVTLTLHQWSRYQGRKEIKEMQKKNYDALHNQPLTLSSGEVTLLQWASSESIMDEDGVTRHGIQSFRALLTA